MTQLTIALTGGIGAGKSTVCDCFSTLGIPIISADQIAKSLTAYGMPAYQQITKHFGHDIILANKSLDRKALGKIIFENKNEKAWLEKLLHPLIEREITKQVKKIESEYCIVEIPLLKPQHRYDYIQRVLLVTAPLEQRLQRIMARDKSSKEQAQAIIDQQLSDKERLAFSDDVIENTGSKASLKQQVLERHQQYLALAQT